PQPAANFQKPPTELDCRTYLFQDTNFVIVVAQFPDNAVVAILQPLRRKRIHHQLLAGNRLLIWKPKPGHLCTQLRSILALKGRVYGGRIGKHDGNALEDRETEMARRTE